MLSVRSCPILVRSLSYSSILGKNSINQGISQVAVRSFSSGCPYTKLKESISSRLLSLNNLFIEKTYPVRKEATKKSLGREIPVILVSGDLLALRYLGKRIEVNYIPEYYHFIKSIAHVACSMHTLDWMEKNGTCVKELKQKTLVDLSLLYKDIEAQGELSDLKSHLPILKEYQRLLQEGGSLLTLKDALLELVDKAAAVRLDALDAHVKELKKQIPLKQRKNIAVIVMGPALPREGELSMQYFKKALEEENSLKEQCPHLNGSLTNTSHVFAEQRLIYAESISEEEKAIELLTSYICDENLGQDLLNDKKIMRADFLMKAAKEQLNHLNIERFKGFFLRTLLDEG